MKIKIKKTISLGLVLAMLLVLVAPPLQVAEAGLTGVSATLSRLAAGVTANHTIDFTMVTPATAGQTIIIQWDPVGHTFDLATLVSTDIIFTGANLVTTCSPTANEVRVAIVTDTTTDTATFTVCAGDTVTAGAKTIVFGNKRITNPIAGSYNITIGGSMTDSGTVSVSILLNDTVVIVAKVDTVLSFSISNTTINFGPLNSMASRWAHGVNAGSPTAISAHNFTVSTNAVAGYIVTITGTTLTIPGTGAMIDAIGLSAEASTIGTEQYGIRVTATGGVGTVSALYAGTRYAFNPVGNSIIASSATPSLVTTFNVFYLANISAITEAGDYTATLTFIATGRF